jgi:hypothetical protein
MTPQNDCVAANIGSIFTVSPNPATLSAPACTGGNETFTVAYNGISGGPNCCATGGPLVPINYNQNFNSSNVVAGVSPFWTTTNHAAVMTIPPYNTGGAASALTFTVNINNYCYNQPGPNTPPNTQYWVTIVVNGAIVYDQPTANPATGAGPVNNSVTINLAALPNGYNQNSNIVVYIYPNTFSSTIFTPNGLCPLSGAANDGRWTAQISSTINATFADQAPTPAVCIFSPFLPYNCCSSNIVADGSVSICSGGALTALTTWQNAVAAANTTCVVYSSVLPVAGSVLPDNNIPNGINLTTNPIQQIVSAYTYCDSDGSATINAGDIYTLVSTFTLTVNPAPTASIAGSTTICGGTGTNITFTGTPNATITYNVNGGANQTIVLNGLGSATLASGNLAINTTYNLVSVAAFGPPVCSQPAVGSALITIVAPPVATFTYPTPICKNGTNPLPTFTGGGVAGLFSSVPASLNFVSTSTGEINLTTTTPGTYTITNTIAAAGGCPQVTATFPIVINTAPSLTINPLPISSTLCIGQSTVNLSVTPTSFASYAWSPAAGLSAVTGSSVTANPSVATSYTIIGTAANGCTSSASILVNVSTPSNAGTNGNIILCNSGVAVDLFASLVGAPQVTGTWSGPSPLSGGNLGTFTPGVNATATVIVTVNDPPFTGIAYPGSPFCNNYVGTVNPVITGVNGGTFSSNPLGLSINSAGVITPSTSLPGTYNVTYQVPASGGCAAYDVVISIAIVPNPAISPLYHD